MRRCNPVWAMNVHMKLDKQNETLQLGFWMVRPSDLQEWRIISIFTCLYYMVRWNDYLTLRNSNGDLLYNFFLKVGECYLTILNNYFLTNGLKSFRKCSSHETICMVVGRKVTRDFKMLFSCIGFHHLFGRLFFCQ